jgi:hypothetical protein
MLADKDLTRLGYLAEALVEKPGQADLLVPSFVSGTPAAGSILRSKVSVEKPPDENPEFASAAHELAKTVKEAHQRKRSSPGDLVEVAKSLGSQKERIKQLAGSALLWAAQNRLWTDQV